MQVTLLMLHCTLLLALLLGTRKTAGLLEASLAVADAAAALELQQQQNQEQEQEQQQTRAEVVLDMVPASARGSFLLYQLAKAINSGHIPRWELAQELEQDLIVEQEMFVDSSWLAAMANEFQTVPVYDGFPMDLQTWLTNSYDLNALDVYQSWRSARAGRGQELCNAAGQCFEFARIISECCPF